MPCTWQSLNGNYKPWIDPVPPVYNKPIQGIYPNCLFIAAINSVAWIAYDFIKNDTMYHDWTGPYQFKFWYSSDPTSVTFSTCSAWVGVNSNLNCDANGLLCGATSANPFETWVGIYEKAYAKFRQWLIMKGYTPFPTNSYSWDPAQLSNSSQEPDNPDKMTREHWGGNPAVVSAHLAGGTVNSRNVLDTTPKQCGHGNYTDIYSIIKTCFCYTNAGKNGAKANLPMSAWTYQDDAHLPAGVNTFNGSGLTPQHSYSILGIWESPTSKYIVLRDTHVTDPVGTAIFTSGTVDIMEKEFDLPHYQIQGQGLQGLIPTAVNLPLSCADGIFGIEKGNFAKYFQNVGWVTK